MTPIRRILIANRGEISCRIARSCRAMGITSIAVFSDADANAMHVTAADESYALGGSESAISYLSIPKIIEACKKTSADAVHPGYGFLSENPAFAQALKEAGIRFIGPTAEVIELMGDKVKAKELAAKVKAPLIPGISFSAKADVTKEISNFAKKNGYPLLIKAAAGGGGRGMRRINSDSEIVAATQAAMREAKAFFGSDEIFVEKLIERARHIEVQLFGDQHGNVVSLSDRDCTMQRNHQKVIEEAPAAAIPDKIREKIHSCAVDLAKKSGYTSAGTAEFLLDQDGAFYFLEVNSRLQVEHPVTEAVLGCDLVELQIRAAQGENLSATLKALATQPPQGAAIELRLCAESPDNGFIAATGKITEWALPQSLANAELRTDTGFRKGDRVTHYYDSLIGKIIVHAATREQAIAAALSAAQASRIEGVQTNLGYLSRLLASAEFQNLTHYTRFADSLVGNSAEMSHRRADAGAKFVARQVARSFAAPATPFWRLTGHSTLSKDLTVDGETYQASITTDELGLQVAISNAKSKQSSTVTFNSNQIAGLAQTKANNWIHTSHGTYEVQELAKALRRPGEKVAEHSNEIISPLPGKIVEIRVRLGDSVQAGDAVLVIESMKMEHILRAPRAGSVKEIVVELGAVVEAKTVLARLEYAA